jgi:hypothetical protein
MVSPCIPRLLSGYLDREIHDHPWKLVVPGALFSIIPSRFDKRLAGLSLAQVLGLWMLLVDINWFINAAG